MVLPVPCCPCARRRAAPLRIDPASAARRQASTHRVYQANLARFVAWCQWLGAVPNHADEVDELLVEWKNRALISKSQFAAAVSAVEFVIPWMRGQLQWSKSVLNDWEISGNIIHHKPMTAMVALLVATSLAYIGYGRLGAGLIIQQRKGLRPSEMLRLFRDHVAIPTVDMSDAVGAVLNLGIKAGTKAKRPQAVIINPTKDSRALQLVTALCGSTPAGRCLFGNLTLPAYQAALSFVCTLLGIAGYLTHSPRAGFASDRLLAGEAFTDIKEQGRWMSDSSLRVYLDVVATMSSHTVGDVAAWKDEIIQLHVHFTQMFPWWPDAPLQPTMDLPPRLRNRLDAALLRSSVPGIGRTSGRRPAQSPPMT